MLSTLLALFLFVPSAYSQIPDLDASSRWIIASNVAKGYHMRVGIPAATRIKAREEAITMKETSRIFRGDSVDIEQYPFFAGLVIDLNITQVSVCGATLVSSTRVVTSAHCWNDGFLQADQTTVVLGSRFFYSGGVRIVSKDIIPHPDFDSDTSANDIAIIYLPYKTNITRSIMPIALPLSEDYSNTFNRHWTTAIGGGLTELESENTFYDGPGLKAVNLRIISNDECSKNIQNLRDSDLCTSGEGRVGPCHGDSGGPLITYSGKRKILVGIIQSGAEGSECGDSTPAVYVRVTSYIYFIESHVNLPTFTFQYEQQGFDLVERITITEKDD